MIKWWQFHPIIAPLPKGSFDEDRSHVDAKAWMRRATNYIEQLEAENERLTKLTKESNMKHEISEAQYTEAQYIKDLKTVHPNMSKEDIEWHLSLSRQSKFIKNMKTLDPNISTADIRKALGNKGRL
jgi:hypothetical protein